jgi:signal transduction histidine kinase
MFHSLRGKIFLSFSALSLALLLGLSYFFSNERIEEKRRHLLDLLSNQVQIHILEISQQLSTGAKFSDVIQSTGIMGISEAGTEFNLDQLPVALSEFQSLPPAGLVIQPCRSEDGQRFLCAAHYIPSESSWILEVTPEESITDILKKEAVSIFLLIGFAILSALVASWTLSSLILSPLRSLKEASQQVSEGVVRSIALPVHRSDEIGSLARSFDRMLKNLQEREQKLATASLQLVHSERLASLGQFGASIAHEVKNPLGAIIGYSRQLQRRAENAEDREALEIILKESERCQQILDRMLRFARQEGSHSKAFLLHDVVDSSILLLKSAARKKAITLSLEGQSPVAFGIPQETQQVVINLGLNAIHAAPSDTYIQFEILSDENQARLRIKNSGSSIPEEIQARIFDPFFSTKEGEEGSGLGLSVSREIARAQGGDLSLLSSSDQETIFELSVPLAKT